MSCSSVCTCVCRLVCNVQSSLHIVAFEFICNCFQSQSTAVQTNSFIISTTDVKSICSHEVYKFMKVHTKSINQNDQFSHSVSKISCVYTQTTPKSLAPGCELLRQTLSTSTFPSETSEDKHLKKWRSGLTLSQEQLLHQTCVVDVCLCACACNGY